MIANNLLIDSHGKQIQLGVTLGSGGEGAVFDMPSFGSDHVAKIYHQPLIQSKQEKLKAMVRVSTSDLLTVSTWPIDTVHDAYKRDVVGFLMPKMNGYQEIHKLYGPAQRKKEFPDADWAFLVFAARNTAAVIAKFHSQGLVIGDINPNNVVVSKKAEVKLIDCDSFQIAATGQRFLCDVGMPHFTPPELHHIDLAKTERTPNHDNFGLAVLCFHLLFMGRHPFAGTFRNGSQDMPIEQAIREYRFAYGRSAAAKEMSVPPKSMPFNIISPELQRMFEVAFTVPQNSSNQRPFATQWLQQLDSLKNNLIECKFQPTHKYYQALPECPWCRIEADSSVLFFNLFVKPKAIFNIDEAWKRITSIAAPSPAELPKLTLQLTPRPIVVADGLSRSQLLAFYRKEEKSRQAHFVAARKRSEEIEKLWLEEGTDRQFQAKLNELWGYLQQHTDVEKKFTSERQRIETQARDLQLNEHLKNYTIHNAKLSGIGPQLVANLAAFGIETAADVTYIQVRRVPEFGNAQTTQLVGWRAMLEQSFNFDPTKTQLLPQFMQAQAQYNSLHLTLEASLRSGPRELERIKQKLATRRVELSSEFEKSSKEVEQARIDLALVSEKIKQFRNYKSYLFYFVCILILLFLSYDLYIWQGLASFKR